MITDSQKTVVLECVIYHCERILEILNERRISLLSNIKSDKDIDPYNTISKTIQTINDLRTEFTSQMPWLNDKSVCSEQIEGGYRKIEPFLKRLYDKLSENNLKSYVVSTLKAV
jgi:hypothetical protein